MTDACIADFAPDAAEAFGQSPLDQAVPPRRGGRWIGGAGAAVVHAALIGCAAWLASSSRTALSVEPTWITEMVEVPVDVEPPRAPLPAPVPEPEPVRQQPKAAPKRAAKTPAPPAAPAAAPATEVLSREPPLDEVVDFGEPFVRGPGVSHAGGFSAATGTSQRAVRDVGARPNGVVGGTGTDEARVDRSRPPALAGGAQWNCPFPREAEFNGVDTAVVVLSVRVSRGGSVEDVTLERDPGDGFGREALRCARSKRWTPGLDRAGNAVSMTSRVNVHFVRSD